MTQQPDAPQPVRPVRRLTRAADDKVLSGVCGGLARYLDVDATLVRLVTAAALLLGVVPVLVVYLVAWAIMPPE